MVLDLKEKKLYIWPKRKVHIGLHIVGIEQVRYYSWSFTSVTVLIYPPEDYIDASLVPFFYPELTDEEKIWS